MVSVETIDALGVSPAAILKAARRLAAAGVTVVSTNKPRFDPGDPMAQWFVEAERRRSQVPCGYRVGDDGVTLVPDAHEQEIIQRARTLRGYRHGYRAIARALHAEGFRSRAATRITHTQVARMTGERKR